MNEIDRRHFVLTPFLTALLYFDFVITFPQEVQRIWSRRFSGATIVYLLTRYSALFERIIFLVSLFLMTLDDKVRSLPLQCMIVSYVFIPEVIMMISHHHSLTMLSPIGL